jgi:4-aminobutyrate aminotransferase-like enzyme
VHARAGIINPNFAAHTDRAFGLKVFKMADTIQKYKDCVMTGFLKSVAPIVIDRASGVTVRDVNGREYLDCFAGISVVNAGHCNPQVTKALQEVAQPAHATA